MKLSQLASELSDYTLVGDGDPEIAGIAYDSRAVTPGSLFVAVPGFHVDGHRFVGDAVARGAAAVVVQRDRFGGGDVGVPVLAVPDTQHALGRLAAAFYGHPSRRLRLIGVTGTDGKTTTTFLIDAVLRAAGQRTGLAGTVGFRIGERYWDNELRRTTQEAPEVQALLAEMVGAGVEYAILETTSHALALERVTGCEYDVGVFTNLTRDHLDFHQTREAYLEAKARLFRMLTTAYDKGIPKTAVLNADDPVCDYLRSVSLNESSLRPPRVITYAVSAAADVRADDFDLTAHGSRILVTTPLGVGVVNLQLPGAFNVYNALAALATAVALDVPLDVAIAGLESVAGVPGRMERVDEGQHFAVIVDYAHTPDALAKALATLRPLTPGRLIVVFGAMGDRDRGKRPEMGRIGTRLADFAILTNEDPASEDPETIIDELEAGAIDAERRRGEHYIRQSDRRQAIAAALAMARADDTVLLAGKGHEHCMIVGDQMVPWDDREVARELLRGMAGGRVGK